jgi:hypothetical protein
MKRYLLPHSDNDYAPLLFEKNLALKIGLAVVALFALSYVHMTYLTARLDQAAAVLPTVLVEQANAERMSEGRSPLTVNPVLEESARLKAEHMAREGYFEHYAPDGTSPWDFFRLAGYQFNYAGENLAVNFTDSRAVTRAWMRSPTHRDNILSERYSEIGIATAKGRYKGRNSVYVVQHFGDPFEAIIIPPQPLRSFQQNNLSAAAAYSIGWLVAQPLLIYQLILFLAGIFVAIALGSSLVHERGRKHQKSVIFGSLLLFLILVTGYLMSIVATSSVVIS